MGLLESMHGSSHRDATARLLADGWSACGIGDWATVWRSPDGERVARISPFEPAYEVFVRLCRRLAGHPLLPRVHFDAPLAGGGRVTVLEFLLPTEPPEAAAVWQRWDAAAPHDPVTEVRREAELLHAEAAEAIPFWGGVDHNPSNVMKSADDDVTFVDLFYVEGRELFRVLRQDPGRIARDFPPHQREYICDIAAIARMTTPRELAELRKSAGLA